MEIKHLKTFLTVAKTGSFTHAADELSYAQSSITAQIQALENDLGVKLFERLGKAVSLTREGDKLRTYAQRILQLCEEAKNAVVPSDSLKGSLNIGVPESLCASRLLPLLTEFHRRFPDVDLSLKFGCFDVFQRMLKENQLDMAFLIEQPMDSPEFVCWMQWPESIALLASPEHPLSKAEAIVPADLSNQTLILTENGCSYRMRLQNIMDECGIAIKSVLESDNLDVMKQLAMNGMGIAHLPRVAAGKELKEGRLVELAWAGPGFDLLTQAVHHKDKWISSTMEAFISLAMEMRSMIVSSSGNQVD